MGSGIDIICATRLRTEPLCRALASFRTRASGPIRFFLGYDCDDTESLRQFAATEEGQACAWEALVLPRMGYGRMHDYLNRLAALGSAEWIMVIADDCFCLTDGWDALISEKKDRWVINTECPNARGYSHDHLMHFAIRRQWFEATGRISPWQQSDTYVTHVAKQAGVWNPEWVFSVGHVDPGAGPSDRLPDAVTAEIRYCANLPEHEARLDAQIIRSLPLTS